MAYCIPKCGHSTSIRCGFDFTSGPIPNNAISKFQTARSRLYAERRRLNPDAGSYQGARFPPYFLPSPKGAALRSHIGDTSPAAGFRIRAEEQDPSRGTRASRGDRSHRRSSPPTICLRPVAVATAAAQRPSRDEGSCASNRTDNGRVAHCAETLKRGSGLRSRAARNRRRSATGARGWAPIQLLLSGG